jgi:pimeloyl-ACP methyl ester carboxylesterase
VNANRHVDPQQRAVAYAQASRFSQDCAVWAPMYRQLTLGAIFTPGKVTAEATQRAYSDVLAAWRDYLANHNDGRGVVLIGHSQGTFVLRRLIKEQIDAKPSVRKRLVSALLLGGDVTVRAGQDVGGDFQNIRACRSIRQVGCVFGETPPADTKFGHTDDPSLEVLCTNPADLGGGAGNLHTYFPVKRFPGTLGASIGLLTGRTITAPTLWAIPPGRYSARCERANGANVLHVDTLDGAVPLRSVPDATWGLHLADMNLPLGNLTTLVHKQSKTYRAR